MVTQRHSEVLEFRHPAINLHVPNASSLDLDLSSNETQASSSSEATLTPDSQNSEPINMAADALTQGCLRQICDNALSVDEPVVQCVQIKPMASQNGVERWRIVMSDSVNFIQGMLGQCGLRRLFSMCTEN